jgi:hypothetical protein
LNTYQQKTYKVVFVRVNGAAKKLNAKEITKYLNKVYNQCAVSFEDSIDDITIDNLTSFSHGGSGILTVYNDDQKTVLQAYDPQMQDGVYYLFFVDNVTDKKDGDGTLVSGYMPRGYNAGFIYDGGSEHTIAHELGHGIAGLEHVFENSSSSGKTKNLMDYASGEELWHFQWDAIQDPSRVWMKWNKDEIEGENLSLTGKFYAVLNGNKNYRLYDKSEITILAGTDVDFDFLADEYMFNLQKSSLLKRNITFDSINIVAIGEFGILLKWDIINQDGNTMNTTLLPPGKYIVKTEISHYYRLVYNKGKQIKFKGGDLQKLSEPVTITFKLTVATQPIVRLEPYDRVNFYY